MSKMRVIVVGGFLGAGKTTLLIRAAKHLAALGRQVGIVTNDQASHLVDTRHLEALNVPVGEIAGGCFCCRFEDLENAAIRLFEHIRPDVLLCEPVGSCTDISATVLQPMKKLWREWAEISPFSVLADPRRLAQTLDGESNFPDSVRYIIKKQFEEADYIVINKTDLLSPIELAELRARVASAWPGTEIIEISALEDRGVTQWLDAVLGARGGGRKILEVDYDTYAGGEAELGWLNASMSLIPRRPTDWNSFALEVSRTIQHEFGSRSAEIGHLKLIMTNSIGQVIANATSIIDKPTAQGGIGMDDRPVELILNARAHIGPDQLKSIVERSIAAVAGDAVEVSSLSLRSFSPAYPKPTHRIDEVVQP